MNPPSISPVMAHCITGETAVNRRVHSSITVWWFSLKSIWELVYDPKTWLQVIEYRGVHLFRELFTTHTHLHQLMYHPVHKQVVLYNVPGQCFGLKSAVLNFNRFPEFSVHCCQRMVSVCVEHFYDDFVTVEPFYMASSGQGFLHFFQDL